MRHQFEAAVIGGGLIGAICALAFARAGLETAHIAPQMPADPRTSALMMPAVDFLRDQAIVDDPASLGTALAQLRIIDATDRFFRAPEAIFHASEIGQNAFGWNFANAELSRRVEAHAHTNLKRFSATLADAHRQQQTWQLTLSDGATLSAALLVGADGKKSAVRRFAGIVPQGRDYAQSALVCDIALERPLGACSVEFHYRDGPFTLVPAGGNKANLVWIDRREVLAETTAQTEMERTRTLTAKAMHLFGDVTPVTEMKTFPLSRLWVPVSGRKGAVLVGEAAHAFPPIGAQGLNLGLRDIACLVQALADVPTRGADWAEHVTRHYARAQTPDMLQTGAFVSSLFGTLIGNTPPAQLARSTGLWALTNSATLRKRAFAFGMGRR